MTHKEIRCSHCKTKYFYQSSGHGCHDRLNDSTYCPDCMAIILKALENVPQKFKRVDCDASDEIDIKTFRKLRDELIEEQKKKNQITFYKHRMGLWDLKTRDNSHSINYDKYWLEYWDKKPDYSITKDMWVDIETGKAENDPYEVYKEPLVLKDPDKEPYVAELFDFEIKPIIPMSPPMGLTFALKYAELCVKEEALLLLNNQKEIENEENKTENS